MPIYKISRRGMAEKRAHAYYAWIRLGAVVLSGVLITMTVLLLLHGRHG